MKCRAGVRSASAVVFTKYKAAWTTRLFPLASLAAACPVQVLYGMDYTAEERQAQHAALRGALLEHLRAAPESREHARVGVGGWGGG
jgi:hypothetical protein